MINDDKKIYLDKKGHDQYLKELQDIRNQLANTGKMKSEAYQDAVGDGWHDNFDFEEAKREETKALGLLKEKLEGLSRIEILDKSDDDELIDISDYVTVDMMFEPELAEKFSFKLIASANPNFMAEIEEISINSPLGKTVYQKKVGTQGSYVVNGKVISVLITSSLKEINKQQDETKTLKPIK